MHKLAISAFSITPGPSLGPELIPQWQLDSEYGFIHWGFWEFHSTNGDGRARAISSKNVK